MSDWGWDEELPAGYQDADFLQREYEEEGRRRVALKKKGWCLHGSGMGYVNPPVYPEQEQLKPGQWVCTETCKQVFTGETLDADPVLVKKEES